MNDPYELQQVEFQIRSSKENGEYSLRLTKDEVSKFVLSKYKPKQKIQESFNFDTLDYNRQTLFLIIGFGFGYVVEKIQELVGDSACIYVIEPAPQLLVAQANLIDKDKFKKVVFLTGLEFQRLYEDFFYVIDENTLNNLKIFVHPHYEYFYFKYMKRITDIINTVKSDRVINLNTVNAIGTRYPENAINNVFLLNKAYDINCHKDKYKDIPALVVSAGPSLDKNLEDIKDFNGLIFCVGRTIQSVQSIGKEVDFTCIVDYSTKIYETFPEKKNVPIIAFSTVSKEVMNEWDAQIYLVDTSPAFKELVDINLPPADSAGSVSTLALNMATFMGCNPIIMVGQDLAYTDKKSYSSTCDVFNEDEFLKKVDPAKSTVYKLVEGYHPGEQVLSTELYNGFRRWIQRHIASNQHITYINATEGGAKILGAMQMTMQEVVEEYGYIEKPPIEHKLLLDEPIDIEARLNVTLETIEEKMKRIFEAVKLSNELIHEYKNYDEEKSPQKIKEYMEELDKADKHIKEVKLENLLRYVFMTLTTHLMTDGKYKEQVWKSDIENAVHLAETNNKMYEALSISLVDLKKKIQKRIEEERENGNG
ncbi:MAG: hypothetical protein BEN19_07880 [Epulopiscium sp. Nuni2H_MBin003]|nr:MAG: hypothetical protein BEN19_07880 [Epulopiscium sp. Nuni2H_MBin003]